MDDLELIQYEEVRLRLAKVAERLERLAQIQLGYEVLFELSPDLVCITSPDGYFIRLNPAWAQLGWTQEELLSKPYIDFVHKEDTGKTIAKADDLFKGQQLEFQFTNRYIGKDGSVYHLGWLTAQSPTVNGYFFAIARILQIDPPNSK